MAGEFKAAMVWKALLLFLLCSVLALAFVVMGLYGDGVPATWFVLTSVAFLVTVAFLGRALIPILVAIQNSPRTFAPTLEEYQRHTYLRQAYSLVGCAFGAIVGLLVHSLEGLVVGLFTGTLMGFWLGAFKTPIVLRWRSRLVLRLAAGLAAESITFGGIYYGVTEFSGPVFACISLLAFPVLCYQVFVYRI